MLNSNHDVIILQAKGQELIENDIYFSYYNENDLFLSYIINNIIILCLDLNTYINYI